VDKQRLNYLLEKYLNGSITDGEKKELGDLYKDANLKDAVYPDDRESVSERMLSRLKSEIQQEKTGGSFFKSWRIGVAAAAIIAVFGIYIATRTAAPKMTAKQSPAKQAILPGTNVAVLTLGNGKSILLNGGNIGKLAVQGGTTITKNAAGQISYQAADNDGNNNEIVFNTITTPMGGQFRVTLPDGSNVWLNAASSLTYPNRFTGNQRHVELHGEAYFEIFKDKNSPFTVTAEDANIKVLGTHFNVMAYKNEPSINTTLLEGSVSLSSKNGHALLVPGQQGAVDNKAQNITLREVNVEDAVAWKNGNFSFRKQNLPAAMNKIARWYNVDVEYSGNVNKKV